jgi:hypothetical protein
MNASRKTLTIAMSALAFLALIQLVPYGRNHTNPPQRVEPAWNSPETRALAERACFDCHSNQTNWPWYANFAPVSWRLQRHVDEGRRKLNFSMFHQPQKEAHESAKTVRKGEMPPRDYLLAHPEARLSGAEKQTLINGLAATLGDEGNERGEHEEMSRLETGEEER